MEYPIAITEEMRMIFKKNYEFNNEDSIEKILLAMQEKGYSQMQSVFLLIDELGISLFNANKIILNSKTWR